MTSWPDMQLTVKISLKTPEREAMPWPSVVFSGKADSHDTAMI